MRSVHDQVLKLKTSHDNIDKIYYTSRGTNKRIIITFTYLIFHHTDNFDFILKIKLQIDKSDSYQIQI